MKRKEKENRQSTVCSFHRADTVHEYDPVIKQLVSEPKYHESRNEVGVNERLTRPLHSLKYLRWQLLRDIRHDYHPI